MVIIFLLTYEVIGEEVKVSPGYLGIYDRKKKRFNGYSHILESSNSMVLSSIIPDMRRDQKFKMAAYKRKYLYLSL